MESIIKSQFSTKEIIEKAYTNFKKSPKDRLAKSSYMLVRIETLQDYWKLFFANHNKLCKEAPDALPKDAYFAAGIYQEVEETYLDYLGDLKEALNMVAPATSNSSSQENICKGPKKESNVKLPKIVIPTFSGKYSEWTTFRDLYTSLIHNNTSIDKVQKMHYLKGYLTGEAEQLLRHVPITSDNYTDAWTMLHNRFNNRKFLSRCLLKRFMNYPSISDESCDSVRDLLDTTMDTLNGLKNLGIDVGSWDVIIIYIITTKLDTESRKQWELKISTSDELPTLDQMRECLESRFRSLEFLTPKAKTKPSFSNKPKVMHAIHADVHKTCSFCKKDHKIGNCKEFARADYETRHNFVQTNGNCFNCLGQNHFANICRTNTRCRICRGKHHSLLHPNDPKPTSEPLNANPSKPKIAAEVGSAVSNVKASLAQEQSTSNVVAHFSKESVPNQVLLATALVKVQARNGQAQLLRALLDQGSQASFVTESAVQLLGLKKVPTKTVISGLGGDKSALASRYIVTINIQSRHDPSFNVQVRAHVLGTITSLLPSEKITHCDWPELAQITLADPDFNTPNKIDILLGADVYGQIIREGLIKGPKGLPVAQNTALGWILSGPTHPSEDGDHSNSKICYHNVIVSTASQVDENEVLKRFWQIESDSFDTKILTQEEQLCEKTYSLSTQRDDTGRYIVRLPFREEDPQCKYGNSRNIALKRFHLLENRFKKNPEIKARYTEVIHEYIDLGHMERIQTDDDPKRSEAVYLPHHAVIREDKSTTKVRVVFDASCKGSNGVSLNDTLMVGPTLQQDLRHIIMRWRMFPICLSADIVKMYRQVIVANEDADFQRLVWRDDPESEIEEYRLVRVTFGTASAPYLAVKTLQQLALDEEENHPVAAEKVKTDFYVDDLMTGCQTVEEGKKIHKEMTELLTKGCFQLQKWVTNNKELAKEFEGEEKHEGKVDVKMDDVIKILGLSWDRETDCFQYSVQLPDQQHPITKRKVVSEISRLFDPLGWAAPCVIPAKVMIQKLWLSGIDWDDELPPELLSEWLAYKKELNQIREFRVPRWVEAKADDLCMELQGFCDASNVAYAAVVYLRTIDADGNVHVNLVTAKTKVAPTMQVSIPRLELMGAVLLAKLLTEVAKLLAINPIQVHGWTDSTVVLAWLSSHPSRWTTFIGNRTSDILTRMDNTQWAHVQSAHNPADIASRGLTPTELLHNELWMQGPSWLKTSEINYTRPKSISTELEQRKVKAHLSAKKEIQEFPLWTKYSSLQKLVRVVAVCRRFLKLKKNKLENKRFTTYLTSEEIAEALEVCIRQCQNNGFDEDQKALKPLCPITDKRGVLRVGGRIQNADVPEDFKHPVILPKGSHFTNLVIDDAHRRTLHGGPTLMLNYLRTKYWILSAKSLVKAHVHKCVTCTRQAAATKNQLMGQLPASRVTPARPFLHSGVDFAGPINIRMSKGRGNRSYKGYICLFICMVTKAIHLEVVSDLTSEGFIAAFKRLVARRGHVSELWSDNGTNFVGASTELQRLMAAERSTVAKEIRDWLSNNSVSWHFIPPHAPNFGGLWEAGVKSTKFHLKRVIGDSTLTYEELATVLTQVESCLNSRPLSRLPNSEDDSMPLTPGHFLIGEPMITIPERNYEICNIGSLRRWQMTQRMVQDFWRRWSKEYLANCLQRYKWSKLTPEPNVGDVVLVKEDNLPPARWLMGRIVEKHPGLDKVTRVVTLKCKGSMIKRPTSKLCVLPITN